MKLSEQVITLEQAKRLKELSVEQISTYYWFEQHVNGMTSFVLQPIEIILEYGTEPNKTLFATLEGRYNNGVYAAFTVAELGEMLPCHLQKEGHDYSLLRFTIDSIRGKHTSYPLYYEGEEEEGGMWNARCGHWMRTNADTEAKSRADMLILLLENGHTTADEVNNQLNY